MSGEENKNILKACVIFWSDSRLAYLVYAPLTINIFLVKVVAFVRLESNMRLR